MKTNNSAETTHQTGWQQQLANAFTSIKDLCDYLSLNPDDLPILSDGHLFPLKVPRCFADCMETGNPNDPLLRQVFPVHQEQLITPGFIDDPVGDLSAIAESGVIHKYHGRVLLITTAACAIHCRYCFRRNFPYSENQLTRQKQQQALSYIANHTDITEVILSGGDPLLLSDSRLLSLFNALNQIPHLKRIRIHSRLPVVLPARITSSLVDMLSNSPKKIVMVLHANHANELSQQVANSCQQLKKHSITLLNQSVLLKGVNDSADPLCELSEKLFTLDILPYYLHQLDKAKGTAHFAVNDETALALHHQIKSRLPGYLVPRLVKEISGKAYKISL